MSIQVPPRRALSPIFTASFSSWRPWLSIFVIATLATPLFSQTTAPAFLPADEAVDVPVNVDLNWPAINGATGYDVYFSDSNSPTFQCRVPVAKFLLETLTAGRTYRWRVDAIVNGAIQRGQPQSFTTAKPADRDAIYSWPIRLAKTVRILYPKPADLKGWNYTEGLMADALYSVAVRTERTDDLNFVRDWLERFVRSDGSIDPTAYDLKLYSLDRIRPGQVLLWTYQRTHEEKYLIAAKTLISQLDDQPRTNDGGFWHRSTYPNQMWLDGIYMADTYLTQFAAVTGQDKYFDEAVKQILLIDSHTHDVVSGLYYHGWDETHTRPWANPKTGASPEFWGRAIGWYAIALADVLDWLPANHPGREKILPIFQALCKSLVRYQDHDTGLWYQIVDKPTAPKNYIETSCSIMFADAMAHGAQRGWLSGEYLDAARRAMRGVLNRKVDILENDQIEVRDTVTIGSLGGDGGTYDYYVNVPVAKNDLRALGPLLYLSISLSETANDVGPAAHEFPRRTP